MNTDETGTKTGSFTENRIDAGRHAVYRARRDGHEAVLVFAPGKRPNDWQSPVTFATLMDHYAKACDSELETLVNEVDDQVWTTWPEIDWAVGTVQNWYHDHYRSQMDSRDDYTLLRIVFVSDKNHLWRIRLMVWCKIGYLFDYGRPGDDRFGSNLEHLYWCTEPDWGTVAATHKPTAWWYEVAAITKFYGRRLIGWLKYRTAVFYYQE